MKHFLSICILAITLLLNMPALAQSSDFKSRQQAQEKAIKAAFKGGKITQIEYNKLIHEQNVIKETMAKFEADDDFTHKEKNTICDKLERADKRLRRYKSNGEVY